MDINKKLIEWFISRFCIIIIKLENNIPLTADDAYLYDILDEYDFYAPKNIRNYKSLS